MPVELESGDGGGGGALLVSSSPRYLPKRQRVRGGSCMDIFYWLVSLSICLSAYSSASDCLCLSLSLWLCILGRGQGGGDSSEVRK